MEIKNEWEKIKDNHLTLSKEAADNYDMGYASTNFPTKLYMDYELGIIEKAVNMIDDKNREIAIDLGCGTGRDIWNFAPKFDRVVGYDFSENMIKVAKENAKLNNTNNVNFVLRDLEKQQFQDYEDSTVSYINAGFGMGSFIKNIDNVLKEINRVLKVGGIFTISVYNKESLVNVMPKNILKPSLSAIVSNDEVLDVFLGGKKYSIPSKSYTVNELSDKLNQYFSVQQILTHPTLTSILPKELFIDEKFNNICSFFENEISIGTNCNAGAYIIATCRKEI